MPGPTFPEHFVWGAATSSYQVEGGVDEGGRGDSIWDEFCRTPGKVAGGDTGEVACDHYHRWREDVGIMQELGLGAYRFSIAWPRVVPEGRGAINAEGLDFYDRLVDGLLDAGIEPFPTLYHWDLPLALEHAGGWPSRATAEAFADYADAVTQRLGDRVRMWTTMNELWSGSIRAYGTGHHAPGGTDPAAALQAAHHQLLAHGLAARVIRENVADARVGIAMNTRKIYAVDDPSAQDEDAARALDGHINRWFFDPVHGLGYPVDMLDRYGSIFAPVADGDMQVIGADLDFVGVNYYNAAVVRHRDTADSTAFPGLEHVEELEQAGERTAMGWPVNPQGLTHMLEQVNDAYAPRSIHVTENGIALDDRVTSGGEVHDDERIEFLARHLDAIGVALANGVPVDGYFVWSLLDNFEWAHGFRPRFGIVHVDHATGTRTIKQSGHWYGRVAAHGWP